jgi:NitT/TauT family transport system ATP-binding protein
MYKSEPYLEAFDISRSFDGTRVLESVSFQIERGEIVALVGPSGCGKTVLLKILSGLSPADSGQISFHSGNAKPTISMAIQKAPLFPWLSVLENLTVCMSQLQGSRSEREERAIALLKMARLENYKDRYPRQLSGGTQQRINVLRAFANNSELILMDEPFVHLDFIQRNELQAFTLEMWEKSRKTIFFVTHDLDEALFLADRILLMTHRPAKIAKEVRVPFGRPRALLDDRGTKEYREIFNETFLFLRGEVHAPGR